MTGVKLGPYIASQSEYSRRKVMDLFKEGRILVNKKKPEQFTQLIHPQKDRITIDGNLLKGQQQLVYYKFNKPWNVLSTLDDPKGRTCIMDFIKKSRLPKHITPVGRLDRYTTGLMILTNNGELAQRLLHPKYESNKIYKVTLDRRFTKASLQAIQQPIELEDGPMHFSKAELISPTSLVVTLHEGRNRIVRRAFETLGYEVKKLKRTHIGTLELDNLPSGKIKALTHKELKLLGFMTKLKLTTS